MKPVWCLQSNYRYMFSKRYDFQWLWMFAVWSCTFLSFLDNLFALMQEIIFILILLRKKGEKKKTNHCALQGKRSNSYLKIANVQHDDCIDICWKGNSLTLLFSKLTGTWPLRMLICIWHSFLMASFYSAHMTCFIWLFTIFYVFLK